MNILYVNSIYGKNDFRGGGLETHLQTIPYLLAKKGHVVTIFTSKPVVHEKKHKNLILLESLTLDSVKNESQLFNPIFILKRVIYMIHVTWHIFKNKKNYDVVEFADTGLEQLFAVFIPKNKIVTRLHSATTEVRSYKLNPLIKYLELIIAKKSHMLVAPSESYANLCKLKYGRADIKVIPYSIPYQFRNNKYTRKYYKGSVLFVGMISNRKGFALLTKVARKIRSTKFICVGGLLDKFDFENLPSNIQIVNHISQQQLIKLEKSHNIFFAPTKFETFGIAILEAMTESMAIVCSNAVGTKDLIDNNRTGLMFEIDNETQAERQLLKVINDTKLAHKLSKNAFYESQKYTPENIAKMTLKVYGDEN